MIANTGPGLPGKKEGLASGETDQPETTGAVEAYQRADANQAGNLSTLNELREAASAIKAIALPDWMRERIIAGLVREHAAGIALEILSGKETK